MAFHACLIGPNGGTAYKHGREEISIDLTSDELPGVRLTLRGELRDQVPHLRLTFADSDSVRELWFGPLADAGGLTHVPLPAAGTGGLWQSGTATGRDGKPVNWAIIDDPEKRPVPLPRQAAGRHGGFYYPITREQSDDCVLPPDLIERAVAGEFNRPHRDAHDGPLDFLRDTGESDYPAIRPDELLVWSEGGGTSIEWPHGRNAEAVVEEWVEQRWSSMDQPRETRVGVLRHDGEQLEFLVAAVDSVEFEAALVSGDKE